ncbi:MAG: hypothetical protein OCC49_13295 [Fibrobacterales bacterium]
MEILINLFSNIDGNAPDWFNNIGVLATIVALGMTIWILVETKGLKKKFIKKARLPEINSELFKLTELMFKQVKNYSDEKDQFLKNLTKCKGLIYSLSSKIDGKQEKKLISDIIPKLNPKKYFIMPEPLYKMSHEQAWDVCHDLSTIVVTLQQSEKDFKWD